METGVSPDFCLVCDRPTSGGEFCSQACRSANQESSLCSSAPVLPASGFGTSRAPSQFERESFHLLPTIEEYKPTGKKSSRVTYLSPCKATQETHSLNKPIPQNQFHSSASTTSTPVQLLTPSGLRRSPTLFSKDTSTQQDRVSDKAFEQLKDYAKSFDQTRELKRRVTTS